MFSPIYKRYALTLMTASYAMSFVDRGLVALLLEPIKNDLLLSDTQLGLITGIAFGLFYAILGVPIARRADHDNRVVIASLALGLWSLTVMACVLVTSFLHLVAARMAAAIGESGCKPPTYSLIGDYFPDPAARTRALAIYMTAPPLSALVSYIVGGWLNELYGWRLTFFLIGAPGVILALVLRLTLVEPRVRSDFEGLSSEEIPSFSDVLGTMWRQSSLRHLSIALVLLFTMSLGLSPWYAAFMIRTHGMGTAELGVWMGVIYSVGGLAGALIGAYVANRWFADNERAQLRMSAVSMISLVPCFALFLTLPHKYHALIALIPLVAVFSIFVGPTYVLMQRLVRDRMRATTISVVMLLANLIGFGVGPQVVGLLSDLLTPSLGKDSLRYAMMMTSFVSLLAGYQFWMAGRTVKQDLLATEQSIAIGVARSKEHSMAPKLAGLGASSLPD